MGGRAPGIVGICAAGLASACASAPPANAATDSATDSAAYSAADSASVSAADTPTESATTLFSADEPVTITLAGPFTEIGRDRTGEPEWHPGTITLIGAAGAERTLDIRVRARGKNRRKSEVCRFPPLRLDIDKKQAKGTLFEGQDKLKLVTHCQTSSAFEQYVLREYLVYRIYNRLSECSFRVRALDIVYEDTGRDRRKKKERTRRGFVIEDRDDVAERCGGKYAKVDKISRHDLVPDVANDYEMFQFLIGNTDWSMLRGPDGDHCCHNAILVRLPDGRYVPVPYDFDAAGFVDAPYAAPAEKLGIDSVTERLYRGFCRPADIVDATIARFEAQRAAFDRLIRDEPRLTNNTRRTLQRFIERFYDTISDPRQRARAIEEDCR